MSAKAPSPTYDRLVALLDRYASRVMVRSVVAQALSDCGVSASDLGPRELGTVVEEVMKGLRTLCEPRSLPTLMVDLAELCDAEAHAPPPRRSPAPPSRPPPRRHR